MATRPSGKTQTARTSRRAPAAKTTARAGTDKRRPQILRAAAKLFQRNGYHPTTMDDVADAVKLNKATVYYHFPGGKSDLLYAINAAALDELLARLGASASEGDPRERLSSAIEVMLGMQRDYPDETIVLHEETRWLKNVLPKPRHREIVRRNAAVRAFVQAIVEDGVADRTFAPCDSAFVAAWVVSVAGSAYTVAHQTDAGELPKLYADLVLSGVTRST